jgi:hypothetical protein
MRALRVVPAVVIAMSLCFEIDVSRAASACLSIGGSAGPVSLGTTLQFTAQCCAAVPALPDHGWSLATLLVIAGVLALGGRRAKKIGLLTLSIAILILARPATGQSCGAPFSWRAQSANEVFTGAGASFSFTPTLAGTFVVSLSDSAETASTVTVQVTAPPKVFLILMENQNWSSIKGSASAPYINGLLSVGAHAEQYFNPPAIHPSEPNYLWLEAGTSFGVANDNPPSVNFQTTTAHLVTQLATAGHSWKAYEEDIPGTACPLVAVNNYAPKHCPMVFFTDVTNNNSPTAPNCIAHIRPYTELAADLSANTTADYNFITPNLCHDMHDTCAPANDSIKQGDTWLSTEVPKLQASSAYKNGAIILITWDEGASSDGPIGLVALGNAVKVSYTNSVHYTHSSTLRTVQEIFGLSPLLGDAANAVDLSDLFVALP